MNLRSIVTGAETRTVTQDDSVEVAQTPPNHVDVFGAGDRSRIRGNVFWNTPLGTTYTFSDFFTNSNDFYAKHITTTPVTSSDDYDIGVRSELTHGNILPTSLAGGPTISTSKQGVSLRASALPVTVTEKGLSDYGVLHAAARYSSGDVSVSAFGKLQVPYAGGEASWQYGEVTASYDVSDHLSVGVGTDFNRDDDISPDLQPHVKATYQP